MEHCAVTAGRLGKATGDVSSRRRSLKGRFCELLNVKRHRFMKRTVQSSPFEDSRIFAVAGRPAGRVGQRGL